MKPQKRKVAIRKKDQKHVPVPPGPRPAFMMIKAELFLELLIAVFYPVPFMVESNQIDSWQMLRHIAEVVPKLKAPLFQGTPFDQEPDLFMQISISPAMGGPNSERHGFCHQRLVA